MQVADSDNISKRMRYYQGLIDIDKLKRGQHYSELGESYIIFICPFDRFKRGRHIYTFRERCDEDNDITLDDGAVKIFLSTKGTADDVSDDIKNFLNYIESEIVADDFIQQLDNAVKSVKSNEKARLDFMTYQMALLESKLEGEEKGRAQGREEGRNEGIESVAFNMIKKGMTFDSIAELTDLSVSHLKELAEKIKNIK